jgi:glutamate-1-semialdehyde 2,1-aminomutase
MRRRLTREVAASLVPARVHAFYEAVMRRKDDDHHASHNSVGNQYLHLVSSSVFIYCYAILGLDLTQAMFLGLGALLVRQFGHAVLEPDCHEEEATLLGFDTRSKTAIVGVYGAIALAVVMRGGVPGLRGVMAAADAVAWYWFLWTLAVVFGRTAYLAWRHDWHSAFVWAVKLVTDPFTDIVAYRPRWTQRA